MILNIEPEKFKELQEELTKAWIQNMFPDIALSVMAHTILCFTCAHMPELAKDGVLVDFDIADLPDYDFKTSQPLTAMHLTTLDNDISLNLQDYVQEVGDNITYMLNGDGYQIVRGSVRLYWQLDRHAYIHSILIAKLKSKVSFAI